MGEAPQMSVDQILVMLREAIRAEEVARLGQQQQPTQDPSAPAGGRTPLASILSGGMNSKRGY